MFYLALQAELKSFSADVEGGNIEGAPSLLLSADNFNVWPSIVFMLAGFMWNHSFAFCVLQLLWLFKRGSELLNRLSCCIDLINEQPLSGISLFWCWISGNSRHIQPFIQSGGVKWLTNKERFAITSTVITTVLISHSQQFLQLCFVRIELQQTESSGIQMAL